MVCVEGMAETEGEGQSAGADELGVVVRYYSRHYPDDDVDQDEEGDDADCGGRYAREAFGVRDGEAAEARGETGEAEGRHGEGGVV